MKHLNKNLFDKVTAKEFKKFMKDYGLTEIAVKNKFNISQKRVESYKKKGIFNESDVINFRIFENDFLEKESFSFQEIIDFQKRNGFRIVDVCFLLGFSKEAWRKYKTGDLAISTQCRRLFKIALYCEKEGIDLYKLIGLS